MIFGAPIIRSLSSRGLVAIIASVLGWAATSHCFSQTISLGQAGQYSIFEAAETNVTPGYVSVTGSSIAGNVALGAGTTLISGGLTPAGAVYIGGAVYEDSGVTVYSSYTTVAGGFYTGTNLAPAAADAANAASTAAGLTANNSFSNNSITGNTGPDASPVNVVNFSQPVAFQGVTLTINGTASEQFVFNFSQSLSLTDTTIVLNGVSASNVFFNILGVTNQDSVSIQDSTFNGTILDLAGINNSINNLNSINISGGVMDGSIIADAPISISNSPMAIVPELPTHMIAGFASVLLVLWNTGRSLLRRRKLYFAVAATQS